MKIKILLLCIILSLFSSCVSIRQSSIFYQPPTFSFVSLDPNSTDEAYVKRMEKYDRILATSPIPVYIMDMNDLAQEFLLQQTTMDMEIVDIKLVDYNVYGVYFSGQKVNSWPKEFIFINKSLTPEAIIATYAHEIGHYEHKKNGCICMILRDPVMMEEHAFLHELQVGWDYNDPIMLDTSVRIMASYVFGDSTNLYYKFAVFRVMKTNLWHSTMAYLTILERQ